MQVPRLCERAGLVKLGHVALDGRKHHAHSAEKESVLFSISDRPAQEALDIWREQ